MGEDRRVTYAIEKEQRSKLCDAEVMAVMKKYGCEAVVQETTVRQNGLVTHTQLKIVFVPTEDVQRAQG